MQGNAMQSNAMQSNATSQVSGAIDKAFKLIDIVESVDKSYKESFELLTI